MCRITATCTGSVTLGVGSEDPPPNRVEIVFPSSEKQERGMSYATSHNVKSVRCRRRVRAAQKHMIRKSDTVPGFRMQPTEALREYLSEVMLRKLTS